MESIKELEKNLEAAEISELLQIEDLSSMHTFDLLKALEKLRKSAHEKMRVMYPYGEEETE